MRIKRVNDTPRKSSNIQHCWKDPLLGFSPILLFLPIGLRHWDELGHQGDELAQGVASKPCLKTLWKRLLHLDTRWYPLQGVVVPCSVPSRRRLRWSVMLTISISTHKGGTSESD